MKNLLTISKNEAQNFVMLFDKDQIAAMINTTPTIVLVIFNSGIEKEFAFDMPEEAQSFMKLYYNKPTGADECCEAGQVTVAKTSIT